MFGRSGSAGAGRLQRREFVLGGLERKIATLLHPAEHGSMAPLQFERSKLAPQDPYPFALTVAPGQRWAATASRQLATSGISCIVQDANLTSAAQGANCISDLRGVDLDPAGVRCRSGSSRSRCRSSKGWMCAQERWRWLRAAGAGPDG